MKTATLNRLLDELDEAKRRFDSGTPREINRILSQLSFATIEDSEALVRFHEILLFLCAYPQTPVLRRLSEKLLRTFSKRVELLRESEVDLSWMETPEVSGIYGTSVTDTFSYPIVKWLVEREPDRCELAWDWFESENRLAETWPWLMPLLAEDALVEANVPYREWLNAARGGKKELVWLIERFASLSKIEAEKAKIYNSQQLYVRWTPSYRASRTGMRLLQKEVFYHREPLIRRKDISLESELLERPVLKKLGPKQGAEILDMAREASTVRYRELYGFTHGDPAKVFHCDLGRGVELFVTALPPYRRLPLRAYHAAMIFKNRVPIGYFEGLSLFERMESGFNLYYTFRDGETAWLYAKILNVFHHLLGVTAFAIDPYQVGFENEEGIESGAFWFYRKLGFRPTEPAIMQLVLNEEKKISSRSDYRTSARILRKLAAGPMIFETDSPDDGSSEVNWDRFQLRKIGLAAQRKMAKEFGGDAERFRERSIDLLSRVLGIRSKSLNKTGRAVLADFAITLSLVEGLPGWTASEKELLRQIVSAKADRDESDYLKLMQQHKRLRESIILLGSSR